MDTSSKAPAVTRLDGPVDREHSESLNPTWADVERSIRALDGDRCSLIVLGIGTPVPHMGIGGGPDQFIVYHTPDNLVFFNLTNGSTDRRKVALVAGGQMGDFERRFVVPLDDVLVATRTYFVNGTMDSSLLWERQL